MTWREWVQYRLLPALAALAVALVLLTLGAVAARAATPAELWEDAQRLSGIRCDVQDEGLCDGPPRVRVRELPNGYVGLYDYTRNPREVLISPLLLRGTPLDGYIVHEYVHYLQWIRGRMTPSTPCPDRVGLEVEAYDVQSRWLVEKTGKSFPPDRLNEILLLRRMACHAAVPHG